MSHQVIRVPGWHWPSYCDAGWWGWRHSLTIGPWLIFWGLMDKAEMAAWWAKEVSRK